MTAAIWGVILTIAALITIALQVRRWRARQVTALQLAAGMVTRIGFLMLGILYASGLVYRWPRAPIVFLGVVGIGIALNLIAGIIENIRRAHEPPPH